MYPNIPIDEKCKQARLKLLEETRNIYYGPDFEPLPTRSIKISKEDSDCVYSSEDGKHCAIGRLDPEYAWTEGEAVSDIDNEYHALEIAKQNGIYSGTDVETLEWLVNLQQFHDFPQHAIEIYEHLTKGRGGICLGY